MRLHVILSLLFIGTNAQVQDALNRIFGNGSEYIPAGYEAIPKGPEIVLKALPKCGEGDQKDKKVCIVYHRCDGETNTVTPEEVINTTGEGLFDIRQNTNECEDYLDVCCKLPEIEFPPTTTTQRPRVPITPPPPRPSYCGIRNERGLDFQITGQTNEAEHGEFPWMVAILDANYIPQPNKTEFLCGASLIAPSVVLTGAHCVSKYQNELHQIKIRAGEWDTLSVKERHPYQERAIKQIIVHKQFNPETIVNDVALLVLDRALSQAENIGTICMPPSNQVFDSRKCFASGWGKKEFGNKKQYSAILKKLQLPMVPRGKCENSLRDTRLGRNFILDKSFVCAGGESSDTCTGDGGSPLVCPDPNNPSRYVQVGIVAWGIGCGERGVPGVYANVPLFRDWIDEQMSVLGFATSAYRQ